MENWKKYQYVVQIIRLPQVVLQVVPFRLLAQVRISFFQVLHVRSVFVLGLSCFTGFAVLFASLGWTQVVFLHVLQVQVVLQVCSLVEVRFQLLYRFYWFLQQFRLGFFYMVYRFRSFVHKFWKMFVFTGLENGKIEKNISLDCLAVVDCFYRLCSFVWQFRSGLIFSGFTGSFNSYVRLKLFHRFSSFVCKFRVDLGCFFTCLTGSFSSLGLVQVVLQVCSLVYRLRLTFRILFTSFGKFSFSQNLENGNRKLEKNISLDYLAAVDCFTGCAVPFGNLGKVYFFSGFKGSFSSYVRLKLF